MLRKLISNHFIERSSELVARGGIGKYEAEC